MSDLFWLTDAQMARLEPFFSKSHGKPRVDDRRVLSGIGIAITMRTAPLAQSDTTSRLPCIIPMASPARHRETAGRIQRPAVQGWGAVHHLADSPKDRREIESQVTS